MFAATNTVRPSGLTAIPSAPSSEGVGVHAPDAPSRPSVPSELKQPAWVIAPVVGSRLRIATEPKLDATVLPAVPEATYTFAPSGETATQLVTSSDLHA